MAKKPKPRNSVYRNEREETPYKRVKRKVFNRGRNRVRDSDFIDDDWVPLAELLK